MMLHFKMKATLIVDVLYPDAFLYKEFNIYNILFMYLYLEIKYFIYISKYY